MKELPQISTTEWQVMKVLWIKAPLTANEAITERGVTMMENPYR